MPQVIKILFSRGVGSSLQRADWERALRKWSEESAPIEDQPYEADGLQLILGSVEVRGRRRGGREGWWVGRYPLNTRAVLVCGSACALRQGGVGVIDGGEEDLWGRLLVCICREVNSARPLLLAAEAGCGVRLPMRLLRRALMRACSSGDVLLVGMLLDLCPPLWAMDWTGAGGEGCPPSVVTTPLMAASTNCFHIVQLLLQRGHVTRGMLNARGLKGR